MLAMEFLSSAYTALEELGIFLPYVVRSFAKSERLSWIFVWTTHGSLACRKTASRILSMTLRAVVKLIRFSDEQQKQNIQ